ncbi:UDP-N-acetyl-D-mannosamine dehydrogenase [Corynebacterium guaraldiae]|uniref:UDP-N-acetyl-D-mannosamine dehydrogenase n=1 Tax=Corynebacterium guaraldiae TaxID=3051103 RepID=UPI00118514D1|nr:UDP-N-acetyl-D-mannosamine dehydrogenase [Corynebacterium guaraldiae]TRX54729.1 UDP-N-acetyl-D-mannosamine dehydrogenase [Corynebacterium guaraldiae]
MTTPTKQHVAFVGLGYIGLPTAVTLANSGVKVTGIDINEEAVERINRGEVTIVEPGLEEALRSALSSGNFSASTSPVHADAYIIAVPTPFTSDHDIDMKFIYSAAESIAPLLEGDELVVLESTSPPKTTEKMAQRILELRPEFKGQGELHFAHCPERILPGVAMTELKTNDRIIGGMTEEATRRATEIYASFCEGELLPTDAATAEMAKLTENTFRDVNIALANELSLICDNLGIDVWELIKLANHHPRVNLLQPGPGVGGHCIAVDPWFIVAADRENSRLIKTAREVNDNKPQWVIKQVKEKVKSTDGAQKVATFGLAFKPDIDDLRESPALDIVTRLADELSGVHILAVEPNVDQLPSALSEKPNVLLSSVEKAVQEADVLVMLVDHKEFKDVEPSVLEGKAIVDTKGLWA